MSESFLLFIFASVAFAFLVLKLGLFFSFSFAVASYLIGAGVVGAVALGAIKLNLKNKLEHIVSGSSPNSLYLVFCTLGSGLLTASIHRYSGDDGFYLAKAVYYVEHPDAIINLAVTWVADIPAGTDFVRFQYYETFQAAIAWLAGLKVLTIAHIVFPFLVGSAAFLAIYLLLGLFEKRKAARLLGSVVLVLIIMLFGDTSRSYGIYTLARAHQGKGVLLFLGFYTWVYFSLKYWEYNDWSNFFKLVVVCVALAALSTTAFAYIPLLSIILFISFYGSQGKLVSFEAFKKGTTYAISLVPLVVQALSYKRALLNLHPKEHWKSHFPSDFWGQVELITGDSLLIPVCLGLSLVVIAIFSPHRKFFLIWVFVTVAFVLNPIVSGFIMSKLTTENIYWRMFYLLPFPLVVVIAVLAYFRKESYSLAHLSIGSMLLIFAIWVSPTSIFAGGKYTTLEWPRYKLTPVAIEVVRRLHAYLPPGTMVADTEYFAVPLTISSTKFPQLLLEPRVLYNMNNDSDWKKEVLNRERVERYLYRGSKETGELAFFKRFLDKHRPDYLMQNLNFPNAKDVRRIMVENNYSPVKKKIHPDYVVWRANPI
ncbi:MAG: DUF6077 domain-containing protein [Desulfovibrionales bacterium]|nr:DUF6077 domain-containing protein [Desulfovibrionales bacterium]